MIYAPKIRLTINCQQAEAGVCKMGAFGGQAVWFNCARCAGRQPLDPSQPAMIRERLPDDPRETMNTEAAVEQVTPVTQLRPQTQTQTSVTRTPCGKCSRAKQGRK